MYWVCLTNDFISNTDTNLHSISRFINTTDYLTYQQKGSRFRSRKEAEIHTSRAWISIAIDFQKLVVGYTPMPLKRCVESISKFEMY